MERLRRALRRHVVAWLLCQATMLTVGPTAFWLASAETDALECTCVHGDHAICPMHHKAPPDKTRCLLQSADHTDTAMLSSLLSVAGLLPAASSMTVDVAEQPVVLVDLRPVPRRSAPPEPPPPRA